jgi:hypothetical protein
VLPNQVYYFVVGKGSWTGSFNFRITDRRAYRRARIGLINRFLITGLRFVITFLGAPVISSTIRVDPTQGPAGTARNRYSLSKWRVTLCLFKDLYQLNADGEGVLVTMDLRYGPIPGLLAEHTDYSGGIYDEGYRCHYDGVRFLGAMWQADYSVAPDKDHVAGTLICEWGEASERMRRQNDV